MSTGIGDSFSESTLDGEFLSAEELEELALAADPHVVISADARPITFGDSSGAPLPSWYMPTAIAVRGSRTARWVAVAVISSFLLVDASGLCVTSGFLSWA